LQLITIGVQSFQDILFKDSIIVSTSHISEKIAFYFLLGLQLESPSHKMQAVRRRRRIWSPNGGSWSQAFLAGCVETGDKNAEATALALHEQQCDIQNAVFCEESLGNTRRRCRSFSERDGPRIILIENLPDKQISCSFSRDHK